MALASRSSGPRRQRQVRVHRPDLKLRVSTRIEGGEVNRGIIGAIIGVLVIIILVIVILQMT
jgi:hypothetical protein